MDGRSGGGPTPQSSISGGSRQPPSVNQDLAGKQHPDPRAGKQVGGPLQGQKGPHGIPRPPTSFKEGQLSGRGPCPPSRPIIQHANPVSKISKPPERSAGSISRAIIEDIASIPLPTQAPASAVPPKPTLTSTSVSRPAPLPSVQQPPTPEKSLISFGKIEQKGFHHKIEANKSLNVASSAPNILTSTVAARPLPSLLACALSQPQKSSNVSEPGSTTDASPKCISAPVSSSKGTASTKGPETLVSDVANKLTSCSTMTPSALTLSQPSEGLSSLVSYSSSSAEASASEDNAQDDQEESSLSSAVEEPMDTSESSSQSVGAPVVESSATPKEVKKDDPQELLQKEDAAAGEMRVRTDETREKEMIPVASPDPVKERSALSTPSKTVPAEKESKEGQPKTEQTIEGVTPMDTKLNTNTSLSIIIEFKDETQAPIKSPAIVKEIISEVCPPKSSLQQESVGTSDGKQMKSTFELDKGEESLQIIKKEDQKPFNDKPQQAFSATDTANKDMKLGNAAKPISKLAAETDHHRSVQKHDEHPVKKKSPAFEETPKQKIEKDPQIYAKQTIGVNMSVGDKEFVGDKKSIGDKKPLGDKKPVGDKPVNDKMSVDDKISVDVKTYTEKMPVPHTDKMPVSFTDKMPVDDKMSVDDDLSVNVKLPVDNKPTLSDTEPLRKIESPQEVVKKTGSDSKPTEKYVTSITQALVQETQTTPTPDTHEAESRLKVVEHGKKRALEDASASTQEDEQEVKEPAEKKARVEESATPSLLSEEARKAGEMSSEVAEPEMMQVDTKETDIVNVKLPAIQKVMQQVQKADEESRDGLEDHTVALEENNGEDEEVPEKDVNSDSKEKDEIKDDETSTPSKRKKKKKKSYERPRGEGGKFMKERPDPSLLDEETRMDYSLLQDEDSQGSSSKREVRRFRCEVIVPESTEAFTAEKVVEYVWPLEGIGEHYFIQEQISQYLGIMSFKRRYPDLRRRPIDMQERDYLKDKGLVSEMACDLGLTAVRSEDVLDVMFNDFPSKFEELQRLLRERKENEIRERGKVNYSMANIDKSKMQEYGRKAAADAARWNASFNKEKREERRYSFDLQTFTLQLPIGRGKKLPSEATQIGSYPVAVLPGQFTDFFRQYTPQALKTMPLSTVVAAPITQDQLGSDGVSSDSEEEVPRSVTDVPSETKDEKPAEGVPRCKVCSGTKHRNKGGKPEPLIICGNCRSASHPTCIDLTLVMVPKIESYNWQCMDCKSCVTCNDPDDEDKMIFCDMCDRGYHIYCVGLRRVPNGRWHCKECAICASCGSKNPAGNENVKNAEWQHEFKKDKDNKQLRYATTLCVQCDKYWKRRQFCYVCLKVYKSIPEDGMVRCSNCPKYIHREVCSTMYENERFCINCFKMRNTTALNHSRIIAAAKKKMASGY